MVVKTSLCGPAALDMMRRDEIQVNDNEAREIVVPNRTRAAMDLADFVV